MLTTLEQPSLIDLRASAAWHTAQAELYRQLAQPPSYNEAQTRYWLALASEFETLAEYERADAARME